MTLPKLGVPLELFSENHFRHCSYSTNLDSSTVGNSFVDGELEHPERTKTRASEARDKYFITFYIPEFRVDLSMSLKSSAWSTSLL